MYVPDHFKVSEQEEIYSFLEANAFGQLISLQDNRLTASHLPFLLSSDRKNLRCHLARQNTQWQQLGDQQVLVTFLGPHDYISPSWYQTPGVPTWNYQALHVYGHCRVFDAADELAALVDSLSRRYESAFESTAPPPTSRALSTSSTIWGQSRWPRRCAKPRYSSPASSSTLRATRKHSSDCGTPQ
jgi:transcriptional regulator